MRSQAVDNRYALIFHRTAFSLAVDGFNERTVDIKAEKYKYISKATFARHFKALAEEDKKDVLKKLAEAVSAEEVDEDEG